MDVRWGEGGIEGDRAIEGVEDLRLGDTEPRPDTKVEVRVCQSIPGFGILLVATGRPSERGEEARDVRVILRISAVGIRDAPQRVRHDQHAVARSEPDVERGCSQRVLACQRVGPEPQPSIGQSDVRLGEREATVERDRPGVRGESRIPLGAAEVLLTSQEGSNRRKGGRAHRRAPDRADR